jgi:fibronectin type 3 domain-containing protein
VAVVNHSVALSWTASASTVVGYNTYSSTTTGGPYAKLTSAPNAGTTYTDSTVQAGLTYYYVVTAVDSSGMESADSTQISATIP